MLLVWLHFAPYLRAIRYSHAIVLVVSRFQDGALHFYRFHPRTICRSIIYTALWVLVRLLLPMLIESPSIIIAIFKRATSRWLLLILQFLLYRRIAIFTSGAMHRCSHTNQCLQDSDISRGWRRPADHLRQRRYGAGWYSATAVSKLSHFTTDCWYAT